MLLLLNALGLFYFFYMLQKAWAWKRLTKIESETPSPTLKISVLVPFRNEKERIAPLLESLKSQNYPTELQEVIFVDDGSEDGGSQVIAEMQVDHWRVFRSPLERKPSQYSAKKWALMEGFNHSRGDIILSTDADCCMEPDWMSSMVGAFTNQEVKLCAGPVKMQCGAPILQQFQAADFCGLMTITGASFVIGKNHIANGANLAYRKSAFEEVGGFDGNWELQGGDDVILSHKISQAFPKGLVFQKAEEAIVRTPAEKGLKAFFQQRLRWTSKNTKYGKWELTASLVLIYLFNLSLLSLPFLFWGFPKFFDQELGFYFIPLLIKMLADLLTVAPTARFLNQKYLLWLFLPFQVLHPIYVVIIGFWGLFGRFSWKGRKF